MTAASGGGEANEQQQAPAGPSAREDAHRRLEDRVAALQAERDNATDRLHRLAAEFDNFRKRTRKAEQEAERAGREAVLLDVLSVIDDLDRALASLEQNADSRAVRDGVAMVLRGLEQKLDRYGVQRVESEGQPFDPRVHDAVAKAARADMQPGTVLAEVRKGYRVGDRLLRPASVLVAEPAAG